MITKNEIDRFMTHIENGYLVWKVKLKGDDAIYQIVYRLTKHITPAGNKSKKRVYYIKKDDKQLIFDDEVVKMFRAYIRPYYVSGI